ncbi:MAG: hypothetical protein ABI662_11200 [Dermatophilaceae bacterium]
MEHDALIKPGCAALASSARADPNAGRGAFDRAAKPDLLVHEVSRDSDAAWLRPLI